MEGCNRNQELNIKIYVACHKESYVPDNPYLYPIQVGTALASKKLDGMLYDDDGENISYKNKSYCELTAQYWAWKNEEADYYGFFHYRRYFAFDPKLDLDDGWGNIAYDRITPAVIQEIHLNPNEMLQMIKEYDVITVKKRKLPRIKEKGMILNIYNDFGNPSFQHRKDLDVALKVLLQKYPQYKQSVEEYMNSNEAYECNMFIMKKEQFFQYCEWLFDILFETEKYIDMTQYSVEECRVMGYLAERLFGIYFTNLKKNKKIDTLELPKTLFKNTDPFLKLRPIFENGIPIVLSTNDKFAPYLSVMIHSIIENSNRDKNYDIIVLNNHISSQNKKMIEYAAKNKSNISIRCADVSPFFNEEQLFVNHHLSVETYYRLIIPELMPEYDKILYLDTDMIVEHDVADLYELDLRENIIAAAKDIDVAGGMKIDKEWISYTTNEIKLTNPFNYFQAGVMLISLDKLREVTNSTQLIKIAMSKKWRCLDQDVLNMVCRDKVLYLPQQWNVLMDWREEDRSRMQIMRMAPYELFQEYISARENPFIVHFAGYQKPWNFLDCDLAWYFWKYAKLSPYYPLMLRHAFLCCENEKRRKKSLKNNVMLRKVANKLLPVGSSRREMVKRVVKIIIK